MNNTKNIVLTTLIVNSFFLIIIIILAYHFIDLKFISISSCAREADYVMGRICFYSSKWDDSTYITAITSFYSTIITILISVQAIITWISFVVIKNSHKRVIEEEIRSELPNYFGKITTIEELQRILLPSIEKQIKITNSDILSNIENYQNILATKIQKLETQIDEAQKKLDTFE